MSDYIKIDEDLMELLMQRRREYSEDNQNPQQISAAYYNKEMQTIVWNGTVTWCDKVVRHGGTRHIIRELSCNALIPFNISSKYYDFEQNFDLTSLPTTLMVQLGESLFLSGRSFAVSLRENQGNYLLQRSLANTQVGCITLFGMKPYVAIFYYNSSKNSFCGLIPANQESCTNILESAIEENRDLALEWTERSPSMTNFNDRLFVASIREFGDGLTSFHGSRESSHSERTLRPRVLSRCQAHPTYQRRPTAAPRKICQSRRVSRYESIFRFLHCLLLFSLVILLMCLIVIFEIILYLFRTN